MRNHAAFSNQSRGAFGAGFPVFPRLAPVTCFPAPGTGYMFSRAWHCCKFSCAWYRLLFFLLRVLIGDHFGFGFTTVIWKPLEGHLIRNLLGKEKLGIEHWFVELPVSAAPVAVLGLRVGGYCFSILSTTRSAILLWSSSCVSLKSLMAVSFTWQNKFNVIEW